MDRLLLTTFLHPGETRDRDKGELSHVLLSLDVLYHHRRPTALPVSWSVQPKNSGISNFRPLHARIIKTGVEIKLFSENTLYYTLYTNAHTYEFIYFVLKRVCVVCVCSRVFVGVCIICIEPRLVSKRRRAGSRWTSRMMKTGNRCI